MCTAITYKTKSFYIGRTLDYDFSYKEEITITPRNYPFHFREMGTVEKHYAMIGIAHIENDYPLYYDAINERGLGMIGLNFVGNAEYKFEDKNKDNIAPFEFIPWILSQCSSVEEAKYILKRINITKIRFNDNLPIAELHWLIADKNEAITVEAVKDGVKIYNNPAGALTNNPPFNEQMFQLNNYMNLSAKAPQNNFCKKLTLKTYSQGMGALGLPGDLSSESRFARVVFTKMNSVSGDSEAESVGQFFHILGTVNQTKGCCDTGNENYEITIYTSCCNADKCIYYYTTYENHQITSVDMYKENINGSSLICYPLISEEQIKNQN
ncbi:MAG: choloylglycine hydrolase family protein [Clostridiales bacterium]|nr:choloylglycine hydrolase family protein [Clostridiales bacterium]